MIRAAGLLAQTVTTTTTGPGLSSPTTLLPSVGTTTTTVAGHATTTGATTGATTTTVAKAVATTLGRTATTVAHSVATTTTTVAHAATQSNAVNNDRGGIYHLFLGAGVSKSGAHNAQIYLDAPFRVVIILLVALVLTRLVSRLSHRMVNGLRLVSPLVQATPRGAARVQTLGGAFTSVFRAVIWIVAVLEVLNQFSINLAPFIAGATVIGAALGFGAQSLVKDFLSGILILAEDQYGVGDHIGIGSGGNITSGTVESVNLRVTRLRGADGGILYVPNGEIRTLSNDTETDSQALVDVVVPFGTDLLAAGVAAQEAARAMTEDPEWSGEFVSEPYFAGVQDATSATGVTLRFMALTRPGQHLRMAREMRYRVIERLRQDNLAWAPAGAQPPALPAEKVRKARVEKRQAEQETNILTSGPNAPAPARRATKRAAKRAGKAAAAKAAVAKRVARKRAAEEEAAEEVAEERGGPGGGAGPEVRRGSEGGAGSSGEPGSGAESASGGESGSGAESVSGGDAGQPGEGGSDAAPDGAS